MRFAIKEFFKNVNKFTRKLPIYEDLLKNSSREDFSFCAIFTDKNC